MSRWVALSDAAALVTTKKGVTEQQALAMLRAAVAQGDIEWRDLQQMFGGQNGASDPIDNRELDRTELLQWIGDGPSEPATSFPGVYHSPFLMMMLDAVEKFRITETEPGKKETLVEHFRQQRLPDGGRISAAQAEYMATFCRNPTAMKGGNKRVAG